MSHVALLVPLLIGAAGVVQASLNRRLTPHIGLAGAVSLNAAIVMVLSLIFLVVAAKAPRWLPPDLARTTHENTLSWWYFIPGILGLIVVAGLPIAVARLGATATFTLLVAGQVGASAAWDHWIDAAPLTPTRLLGAALAMLAVIVSSWK